MIKTDKYNDWSYLIPEMKAKAYSTEDLKKEYRKKTGKEHPSLCNAQNIIDWLSKREPVYEVSRGIYKILTKTDLEEYRKRTGEK